MNNCSGIYRIDCRNQCLYVGQSINLRNRKSSHLRRLRKNTHYNIHLQRMYNKYKDDFNFSIIEECEPSKLTERELFWITQLHPKCNIQIPMDSTHFTITEQSRKKMSKISSARMTPEMKEKISIKTKEAMHRPDVWENFLEGQNNKPKKSPWNKGLKNIVTNVGKRVYCVELNMYFSSATSAAKYIGANNPKGISRVCLGERHKYKNLHFEYVDK